MKYIKLFEERLRDYEILSSNDSDLLISELKKEIYKYNYDIEYIIDLVTYGHFDIDVLWFDERDEQWSFLMKASAFRKVDIVKALLDNGADPNLQNNYGLTALMYAAERGNSQVVQELLKHPDTNPNLKSRYSLTALMYAASWGHTQAVQELLKHPDIDPNLQDIGDWTALMKATDNRDTQAVQELLSHPAIDITIINNDGQTAWDLAWDGIREQFPELNPLNSK